MRWWWVSAFKDKFKSSNLVEMPNYFPILHRRLAFKDKFKSSDLVEMSNHFPILHRRLMSQENRSLLSYLSPFPLALYPAFDTLFLAVVTRYAWDGNWPLSTRWLILNTVPCFGYPFFSITFIDHKCHLVWGTLNTGTNNWLMFLCLYPAPAAVWTLSI